MAAANPGANPALRDVLEHLRRHESRWVGQLREFVAIPSVSTDPTYRGDVHRAADWVAARLRAAGPLAVERVETAGHPTVLGSWDGRPGAPTVLIYGHLDVQPPDPLDAWDSPPFELTERSGRWYARGVSDDKASMLIPIVVADAFFRHGGPPVNLRFLFESEEEVGSPHLPALVRERADQLACDLVLSADGGMWRADPPSLTVSARGMIALEFELRTAAKDLHSGRYGGAVPNPLQALATLLASLHDAHGRVAVAGFYDGVPDPDPAELAALAALPFDERAYLDDLGLAEGVGEAGYGTLARQWLRPTLEINGLGGGYQGPGSKTVIPARAAAKLSCRLVAGQDPATVRARLRRHLETHLPRGVELTVSEGGPGAAAYRIADDHPALVAAAAVLERVTGSAPLRVGMGGSVPICAVFHEVLGADTLFFSFSVGDEDIHAPNEFYRPERFRSGLAAWAELWAQLAADA